MKNQDHPKGNVGGPRAGWNLKREISKYLRGKRTIRHSPSERKRSDGLFTTPHLQGLAGSVSGARWLFLVAFLVLIVSIIGCENQENVKRGMVTGLVLDTNNHTLPGATLTSHRSLFQAKTGSDGRYSFTSLDPGTHRITVEKEGYKNSSTTITIESAEVHQQIDFRLEPMPFQITWTLGSRTADAVVIDVTTVETMKCQVAYQGEHLPMLRTPYSPFGTDHRFLLQQLIPNTAYRFTIEGETTDGRIYGAASGTFKPIPPGDIPGAPPAPTEVKVTQTKEGTKISWSQETPEPIQGFRLYRGEEDKGLELWQDENFLFSQQRSVIDDSAKPGVRTRYAIEAVDLDGTVSSRTLEIPFMTTGRLTQNVTWKQKWGSIDLFGDIWIPEGLSLVIEPGLIIRVSPIDYSESGIEPEKCEIVAEGRLVIGGTPALPVRFISAAALPNRTDWAGIRVRTPKGPIESILSSVEVFNAANGIILGDTQATISNYSARYCDAGLQVLNASGTSLSDLSFNDCAKGLSISDSWNCSIASFSCRSGDVGVSLRGNHGLKLSTFDVRGTLETGLYLSDAASLTVQNGVIQSQNLGVYLNGGVDSASFLTVDAPTGVIVDQQATATFKDSIIVNMAKPGTGVGLEDRIAVRSYPFNNIFNFQKATVNCDQNGGPVLNADPLFLGGFGTTYDYHLQEASPVKTASDKGAEIGAYGAPQG